MKNTQPRTVSDEVYEGYLESLRDEDLTEHLEWSLDYWRDRNTYIETIRLHLEGLNPVEVPRSKFYKAKVLRAYSLSALVNEKLARYLSRPEAQIIVEDPTDADEVARASEIEKALKNIAYESERIGDGNSFDRMVEDLHLLDTGVLKVLFNPAVHWKELVEAEKRSLIDMLKHPFESGSKRRREYMLQKGCPIETHYVPLENWLPVYTGSQLQHCFEIDVKSLYTCKTSPLFDAQLLDEYEPGKFNGLDTMVPIVHFCNDIYYAYYAMPPGTTSSDPDNRLKINPNNMSVSGDMELLYVFKHGLGRSTYIPFSGRHGGWKTQNNRIEFVNRGLLQMSQATDEMWSQVYTNIRASDWPSMKFKVNPELRGWGSGGTEPKAPEVKEGEEVVLFVGEELDPIVTPQDDPKVPWLMGEVKGQIGNLGGSSVLFGHRQPGVDTGYQNQQQISQAEHLDSKIEEHYAQGAIEYFTVIMQYAKVFGEPIPGYYIEPPDFKGIKQRRVVELNPKNLEPLPKIDTKVRKTRPIDFMTAGRLAKELSDERQGKGPLLSDYTILTEILGRDNPEIEQMLVRIEKMERTALEDGTVMRMIVDATNLKVAKQTQGSLQPGAVAGQNNAAIQAAIQLVQNAPQMGGLDTNMLVQLLQQAQQTGQQPGQPPGGPLGTGIRTGGMLPGDSQPEARIGEAVAGAEGMR